MVGGWVCKPILVFSLGQAEQYDSLHAVGIVSNSLV